MNKTHLLALPLLLSAIACGSDDDSSGTAGAAGSSGTPTVDDAKLGAQAAAYASSTKANAKSFQSAQHMGNPMVNVYVSPSAAATYAKVGSGEKVTFAEGTMIVKEMLGPDGKPMMLTAMYKAPAGYDAKNRDWWWGMLTLDGKPAQAGSVGKIDMCNSCHQGTPDTDATFGVPAAGK